MTDAGLAKIKEAKQNGRWGKAAIRHAPKEVPVELTRALAANKRARNNFEALAPSYQKHYIGWIASAKREKTRLRRVREAVELLTENRKLGLK